MIHLNKTLVIGLTAAAVLGGGLAANAATGGGTTLCRRNSDNVVLAKSSCGGGFTKVSTVAKGDTGAKGADGVNGKDGTNGKDGVDGAVGPKGDKGDKGDPGDNNTKVTHKSVLLNADSPVDGSSVFDEPCVGPFTLGKANPHCYRVVLKGAPAYTPASVHLYYDNSGGNTWAPDADVMVRSPFFSVPANGSTDRTFHVQSYGFTNTKSFNLDIGEFTVTG